MKLIVGLGNPGKKYSSTRHNIGASFIDYFADKNAISLKKKQRYLSYVGFGEIKGQLFILAKPITYMNVSGSALVTLVKAYQVAISELLVVYDDFSLDFGTIRIRRKGSAGGHNGLDSVIGMLDSDEIARIRIGIGPLPEECEDSASFVLSSFSSEEHEKLGSIFSVSMKACNDVIAFGVEYAMNNYNNKATGESN